MNEPDLKPRTPLQLWLLPALAFILAILLIALAAVNVPDADAQDWTPAPPSITEAVLNFDAPIIPDQEIRVGRCPLASADVTPDFMAGCTWAIPDDMPIYITDPTDTMTLAHEYGHRVMGALGPSALASLALIVHWRSLRADSERGADAYMACALGWRPFKHRANGLTEVDPHFPTANGYWPNARQHRAVCAALWTLGERAGLR